METNGVMAKPNSKNTEAEEPKSIQVFPRDKTMDEKINELAKNLRTSRAGIAGIALDFAVSALTAGKAHLVNGKLEFDHANAA
jgi:hypothetical protein